MSTKHRYIPQSATDANVALDRELRASNSGMSLKSYKILKSTVLSLAVLGFGAAMVLLAGADPNIVGVASLALVALIAGIEMSELADAMAVLQGNATAVRDESEQNSADE